MKNEFGEDLKCYLPFYENQKVLVSVNGEFYKRKVRYNKQDGLYIMVKNCKYFEYEFEYIDKPNEK